MPKYEGTLILRTLRDNVKLSTKQVADFFRMNRPKTVIEWELGEQKPHQTKRDRFFDYLCFDLEMCYKPQAMRKLWELVMVTQWGWEPLTRRELYILSLAENHQGPKATIPILPQGLGPQKLIGRETCVQAIKEELEFSKRISLTGLPGVGKTALAIAIAADKELQAFFPAGVLWAHVGQNADVDGILLSWAKELKLDTSRASNRDEFVSYIRRNISQKRMLIIIDDAWTVEEAESLAIGGSNCWHLLTTRMQPVAQEFARSSPIFTIEELEHQDAVSLLCSMASIACKADRSKVEQLVASVGGLPLGIVVLAGYLGGRNPAYSKRSVQERITRLETPEERLNLAIKRLGVLPVRSSKLREILELSLDSLDQEVQTAFFELGAFASKPSRFTLEAALLVANCDADTIDTLIARNLVEHMEHEDLTIHPVICDLARSRTTHDSIIRHRNYYHWCIVGPDPEDWQTIQEAYSQISWAWHQMIERSPDDPEIISFHRALRTFHLRTSKWQDFFRWSAMAMQLAMRLDLKKAVVILLDMAKFASNFAQFKVPLEALELADDVAQELGDPAIDVLILLGFGHLFQAKGNHPKAMEYFQKALVASQGLEDKLLTLESLIYLGSQHAISGSIDQSIKYFGSARELAQELKRTDLLTVILPRLATAQLSHGDLDSAQANLLAAKELMQKQGDLDEIAAMLQTTGDVYMFQGHYQQAYDCFLESIERYTQSQNLVGQAYGALRLATLHSFLDEYEEALDYASQAKEIFTKYEVVDQLGKVELIMGTSYSDLGQYDLARDKLSAAIAIHYAANDIQGVGDMLSAFGILCHRTGDNEKALEVSLQALSLYEQTSYRLAQPGVLIQIGQLYALRADSSQALAYLHKALNLALALDLKPKVLRAHLCLAKEYERIKHQENNRIHLEEAKNYATELGYVHDVQAIEAELAKLITTSENEATA